MLETISDIANDAISNHVFPGCVVEIVDQRCKKTVLPFGHFTYDPNSPKVENHTIYDFGNLSFDNKIIEAILGRQNG